MDAETHTFCIMIRNRSAENRRAMQSFRAPHEVLSPAFSILRQELDSMTRVIYLLQIGDLNERRRLICSTLQGEKWKVSTANGKFRDVTDREMVDISQQLEGWTQSVYRFGCSFIHLSDFHNHFAQSPFQKLTEAERQDVFSHMRYYHDASLHESSSIEELSRYIPRVFDKIADNLKSYVDSLERGESP